MHVPERDQAYRDTRGQELRVQPELLLRHTSGSTISVANGDARTHNFTVKHTDVAVLLPAGMTGQATALAPGTYDFLCTFHPRMTGTIIVT